MVIISSQTFLCGKNGKPQPPLPPQGVDANRHPQRQSRCRPLSEAMQPFYTTCGASRAPFFIICGEAATTTLGPKARQT